MVLILYFSMESARRPERVFFFFFLSAPFWTAEVSGLDCFTGQSPGMWTKRVGHFYPGGPGIAREMAKSKPELLNEGLGGGWARGVVLGPRPGWLRRLAMRHGSTRPSIG